MANSMFNYNITGNNYSLSNFIGQSLGRNASQGSLGGLTSVLSDYSSIKTGSYGKLMKAYYQKDKASVSSSASNKTDTQDKTQKTPSSNVLDSLIGPTGAATTASTSAAKKEADKTSTAAATKLVDATTALDKMTYSEANRDKIAEAVGDFVNEYNNTLKAASESKITNVRSNAEWMASGTKTNQKLLSSVGITINEDNTLSFDKEKFASANITTAKSVFDGKDSYAHSIANRASKIYAEAATAGNAAFAYTSNADYASATTGTMLDSIM